VPAKKNITGYRHGNRLLHFVWIHSQQPFLTAIEINIPFSGNCWVIKLHLAPRISLKYSVGNRYTWFGNARAKKLQAAKK